MNPPLRIIHVEDDHLLAEDVTRELLKAFPGAIIESIRTELDFRRRMLFLATDPPTVIIFDVMLRWTDPHPSMQLPPPEVAAEGRFRAGLRCWRLLAEKHHGIPVIFYTILEKVDLQKELSGAEGGVTYVTKSHDHGGLLISVRKILSETNQA